MSLRGSLKRRYEEHKLHRALSGARKKQERGQALRVSMEKERELVAGLEEKRKYQALVERRKTLQRKTGSGLVGFGARLSSGTVKTRTTGRARTGRKPTTVMDMMGFGTAKPQKPRKPRKHRVTKRKVKRKRKVRKRGSSRTPRKIVYY